MKNPLVLIADDHAVFRSGLRILLSDAFDAQVVECDGFDAAVQKIGQNAFDLAVFDLHMPGLSDPAILRTVRESHTDLKIVVVTGSELRDEMLGALSSGINGYIPKSLSTDEMRAAIQMVMDGGVYVPALITALGTAPAAAPAQPQQPPAPTERDVARLSPRQRDVLLHLAEGRSTKEIARSLDLAEATVKVYLAAVYRFLGARNRAEAVSMAARLRI
jgi:DNA-binding NarL/FixJ family response regulator